MPTINKLNKPNTKPVVAESITSVDAVVENQETGKITLTESKTVGASGIDFAKLAKDMETSKSNKLAVNVPSFLRTSMPETSERELTGYVGFCSEASKNYPEQQAAGLSDGDIFLFHQGQFLKTPQLDFFLATGESFKSVMDSTGNFVAATRDLSVKEITYKVGQAPRVSERKADGWSNPKLEPHYVCLCIVNINGRLIPIKGDFRGTKSGGIESAISAVRAAGDAKSGWLRLSEAHTATAAFPEPFGRVFHMMRSKHEVSKSSGKPYYRTVTVSGPSTIVQMELLLDALGDDEFNKSLAEAHANYRSRVDFMDNVINPKPVN